MSDKPTTGEWTLEGCCIRVQDGAIICVDDAAKATTLRQYHNAALAAEERRANDSIEENVRLMNRLATALEKHQ